MTGERDGAETASGSAVKVLDHHAKINRFRIERFVFRDLSTTHNAKVMPGNEASSRSRRNPHI